MLLGCVSLVWSICVHYVTHFPRIKELITAAGRVVGLAQPLCLVLSCFDPFPVVLHVERVT